MIAWVAASHYPSAMTSLDASGTAAGGGVLNEYFDRG